DRPMQKPKGKPLHEKYTLNDDFSGNTLRPHWKFFKEYDPSRFLVQNNCLTLEGRGNSVADCAPLLCIPSDHSYTAQVEMELEGDATGGLVLFYSEKIYSGILADKENVLANLRGWQFPSEKNVLKGKVFLRLKNTKNTVDMFYSLDGTEWRKIENSFESSAYHHNVLSGFMSLRIGLCSMGSGKVAFRNFEYRAIP
ncbi:MAG TPA: hypothetical protein PLK12_07260, partial [Prolixibacteraceae bacterium]|nr:hypothetical protein [Prolixibacteraceae bacterium]